jgi:phospholipid/cholesterol/gamma-HCH transport system ATP-binding protein
VLERVTKRHEGRVVLDDVSLEVRAGEILGLVGPGGHGKSVLLKHLPRLIVPDAGRVLLDGKDLAKLTAFDLARAREGFGYLFQNYALFDFMTVADNVAFPLRQEKSRPSEPEIERRVRARLAEVGLTRAYHQFPRELSGGMKKRVGLARATVTEPQIALYDDPTAGLDPVTSSRIFALILEMHRHVPGCASLVVSHDVDRMAAIVDRWVVLEHGRVVFSGDAAALASALAGAAEDSLLARFFPDAGLLERTAAGPEARA